MKASPDSSPEKITISDIANQAGVSIGLVSSFLTGRDYRGKGNPGIRIARKTAERIRQTCREMGYWPEKPIAFNRVYPEYAEVCLLYPRSGEGFQGNRYFSLILSGILDAAMEIGTKTSIAYFDMNEDYRINPERIPFPVVDNSIRKYIVVSAPNHSLMEALIRLEKHVVYISRKVEYPEVASVVPDYRQAANIALSHLAELGHRDIGLVANAFFKGTYNARELREGIREAAISLGLNFHEEDLYPENSPIPETINRLLSRSRPPTAFFGFDDLSAEEAMSLLANKGFSIPEDISVIGCNDEKPAASFDPPMTTVHIRTHQLGRNAVKLVNQIMESSDGDFDRHLVLPVYLVERASTRSLI